MRRDVVQHSGEPAGLALWGFTSHRMTIKICDRCRYVMHFHDAHSIFDVT